MQVFNKDDDRRVTELLKICLQKVCELQQDLAKEEESENNPTHFDAEEAGYSACALETMRFLAREGLGPEHPMVRGLKQRLHRR